MSEIKVNKVTPRVACGTTQLGDSGDTITIPSGATITNLGTATGFGATGAVSWNTTKITADPGPAVTGTGYFCDTSGGAFTVTLPLSPSAGDVVGVSDYANTFGSNDLTLGRNSEKIEGDAADFVVNIEGAALTLVYVDGTKGWIVTDSGNSSDGFEFKFITATGGTPCTGAICGDYKVHTFTGPGTFTVNNIAKCAANNALAYMVVAGGGSGGARNPGNANGGGGGGGFREGFNNPVTPYTASPLAAACSAITAEATPYPIAVGGGGTGISQTPSNLQGNDGNLSTFSTITSAGGGGGGGGGNDAPLTSGRPGGSGGAAGGGLGSGVTGGTGNTPSTSPAQGKDGGIGGCHPGGNGGAAGGGGATEAGLNQASAPTSGRGGAGATTSISNSPVGYSGGAGGSGGGALVAGAASPCGSGAVGGSTPSGSDAAINRGGGGGGGGVAGGAAGTSGAGGSGVVIIRYKYQ